MKNRLKRCSNCKIKKPLDAFYRATNGTFGRQSHCKQCGKNLNQEWYKNRSVSEIRNKNLRKNYGITSEEYDRLLKEQDGGCVICNLKIGNRRTRFLHVDHDHSTGLIRGLLCSRCNTALGLFRDNLELLRAALDYLD